MANEFKFEESEALKNLFEAVPTKKNYYGKIKCFNATNRIEVVGGCKA